MVNFTNEYKKIIVSIVIKYIPNAKIILYGSRARGDFSEGADIKVTEPRNHYIQNHKYL